ncbi:MAG TPA: hypothetical protein VHP34_07000 [Alphaproteobacteria bacterium]|nr:hypothetical protein [Alphaproteobacteria bacterium]
MTQDKSASPKKAPPEIRAFLDAIGPRQLTPEEARQLNILRLKNGLPAASPTGTAENIHADNKEKS